MSANVRIVMYVYRIVVYVYTETLHSNKSELQLNTILTSLMHIKLSEISHIQNNTCYMILFT